MELGRGLILWAPCTLSDSECPLSLVQRHTHLPFSLPHLSLAFSLTYCPPLFPRCSSLRASSVSLCPGPTLHSHDPTVIRVLLAPPGASHSSSHCHTVILHASGEQITASFLAPQCPEQGFQSSSLNGCHSNVKTTVSRKLL
jgi:hypothetical protein